MSANAENLNDQLNVRVPRWLKEAVEHAAQERSQRGARVKASDVAREILWPHFEHARPKQLAQVAPAVAVA
jgi:hypothetical protein